MGQKEESALAKQSGASIEEDPDREAQPVDAEQPPRLPFPVVGIGASAGGLEAVSELLAAMPPASGMAFVLVQHLPPDRESLMAEILGKRTAMPVRQVEEGMAVEPNHVYVIRPGHVLTIRGGVLHLGAQLDGPRAANRPVDDFFRSLAEEQRERAICIIMSGMGSNGTAGAQVLKAVGGLCVAQDPDSAQFPSMPQHLIDAGYADYVLRPADIPEVLTSYAEHPYARGGRESDSTATLQENEQNVRDILALLRTRTRKEFGGYKKGTILRRVQRRMGLAGITRIEDYAKMLRQSPAEVTALADDLLIHVTGFFRDSVAWDSLQEKVIVPLIASRESDGIVRCWVTACATGEEAYSLAILLVEEAERLGKNLDIKVFATDMAERTLVQARNGTYPGGIESEISPERLGRFFHKEDAIYRVRQDLRDRVVFAPQNVLQDPPFSRLDIVSCRNLLIYLDPDVQQRVLRLIHFGLRENGMLFLGTSETLSGTEDLFESVDKKARIFRRVGPTRPAVLNFPLSMHNASRRGAGSQEAKRALAGGGPRPSFAEITQRTLLEGHVPAAVLVDRQYRILYFQGNTSIFLEQPSGEPTRDLLVMAREGVRAATRVALQRASAENRAITVPDGWVHTAGSSRHHLKVTASPAVDKATATKAVPEHFVVSFELQNEVQPPDLDPQNEVQPPDLDPQLSASDDPQDIAQELRRVQDELQSTIEELQTSNEEMKASNEEITSINEELQSTNEELETSKEEMQALNEELTTVNAQLQAKIEEHLATSSDLASLLTSTNIAVLFLDTQFRIRRYTPAMRELFDLIASDVGRPLSDLARKFTDAELVSDAQSVLSTLAPIQREITSATGQSFLRRITPYRTSDNRIQGVVVAFVDVTAAVEAAARLAETARLLDLTNDAIIVRDTNNRITYWNRGASEMFGWSTEEALGKDLHSFLKTQFELPLEELLVKLREHDRLSGEVVQVTRDGRRLTLLCRWALDRRADGAPQSILTTTTDITERKLAQNALEESHARLESQVKQRTASLRQLSSRLQRAQDEERRKIARELHDSVGQYLTALKMNLALMRQPNAKDFEKTRDEADQLLDTCLAEIRTISYLLHPPLLDESGLSSAAQWYVEGFGSRSGIQVKLDVSKKLGRLPQAVETSLFRALQESLTNVHRHSGSERVDVRIELEDGQVELMVRDYGRGISLETLEQYRSSNGKNSGVGLAGMRERVHELEGKLELVPQSPGTCLRVTIPIQVK